MDIFNFTGVTKFTLKNPKKTQIKQFKNFSSSVEKVDIMIF